MRLRTESLFVSMLLLNLSPVHLVANEESPAVAESVAHGTDLLWTEIRSLTDPMNPRFAGIHMAEQYVEQQQALHKVLDGILNNLPKLRDQPPLQRVIWQQRIWLLHDHAAGFLRSANYVSGGVKQIAIDANLNTRLRTVLLIRMLALSEQELRQLEPNYKTTLAQDPVEETVPPVHDLDLPEDLLDSSGPWLQVRYKMNKRIGISHESIRGHRSEALLFVRFPDGRQQAEAFIDGHNRHAFWDAPLLTRLTHRRPSDKPQDERPVIPTGTETILVLRMLAVLANGNVVSTPIIESIEFNTTSPTRHAAFKISAEDVLSNLDPKLRRVRPGELFLGAFPVNLSAHDCRRCHSGRDPVASLHNVGHRFHAERPDDMSWEIVDNQSSPNTRLWKMNQFDYGLLRGHMERIGIDAE